jgi:threonine synthase
MPVEIARHSPEELEEFRGLPFTEVCFRVARPFATPDVPEEVLWQVVSEAINFPVNLVSLSPGLHILELFHGPTLAFKDFGARFMARLMGYFVRGETRPLTVLVATSGDTGSAVAHGFLRVPGIRVVILYPSKRISEAQEKQFTTLGENITALEVAGTFDDCQRLVKQAFSDAELNKHAWLTSANSINIGRLLPQMFYHVAAYRQLPVASVPLIVSVPSGNFGNLTAGIFAKRIGLPVARYVASTNANDVVPEYLRSGEFRPRPDRHVFECDGCGQSKQFSALARFVSQPPRIRAKGNLGPRCNGRRNARRDEDAPRPLWLHRRPAHGRGRARLGSLQAGTYRARTGLGAGYSSSREIRGRGDESHRHRASAPRPPCRLFET